MCADATGVGELRPRDIIPASGIHHKRCWFLLSKWTRKGLYDYGVCLDLGWLTDAGETEAERQRDLLKKATTE
jgi:hypothetical protein